MARLRSLVGVFLVGATVGCGKADEDVDLRARWIWQQTDENKLYLRQFLNGSPEMQFYDGWYEVEHDPKGGGAWRWMDRRGIVRLATRAGANQAPVDMELRVFGWVPHQHLGLRTSHMEFAINGHVIGRFEPPHEAFEHALFVPRHLLGPRGWVDLVIMVANTARPPGDWRDLGFATTGFHWKPATVP